MQHGFLRRFGVFTLCTLLCSAHFFAGAAAVYADPPDYRAEAQARKSLPIQSNEIENWPTGPQIGAQGAILMEAETGTILYAKNIDEKLYPASTTKILTALVAMEHSSMDEDVSFSHEAVFSIEKGSSHMGMDEGQVITMEQCLYGILVYSANEVCNAIGEHIAGSIDAYVDMMNKKAAELGCTNSHFVTTNGLHDDNHYTTPRDLATIACAFFQNETLCKISRTNHYYIGPTATQPDEIDLWTHNSLTAGTYQYEGYVGGKTGYTTTSRQTLVSCAERDGMKLICVIMREESPDQFLDTIALFDYGFNNFQKMNIAENETNYTINDSDLFNTQSDIFFNNDPIVEIDTKSYVVIPKTIAFTDLTSSLSYETKNTESESPLLATINYEYQNTPVGSAAITLTPIQPAESFESEAAIVNADSKSSVDQETSGKNVIFINVLKVIGIILLVFVLLIAAIFIIAFCRNYHFAKRRKSRIDRKRRRNRSPKNKLHF